MRTGTRAGIVVLCFGAALLSGCSTFFGTEEQAPDFDEIPAPTPKARAVVQQKRKPGQPVKIYPTIVVEDRPEVRNALDYYSGPGRKQAEKGFQRKQDYRELLDVVFRQHGLPLELSNIPIIESCFNADSDSGAGHTGVWQFSSQTGRTYGLSINFVKDERLDVAASSAAAARYLGDLYETYGDWPLAVAAYNCGSGRVNRAIKDTGTNDFFELARRGALPQGTKQFVSKFLALALIERDPGLYGISIPAGGPAKKAAVVVPADKGRRPAVQKVRSKAR